MSNPSASRSEIARYLKHDEQLATVIDAGVYRCADGNDVFCVVLVAHDGREFVDRFEASHSVGEPMTAEQMRRTAFRWATHQSCPDGGCVGARVIVVSDDRGNPADYHPVMVERVTDFYWDPNSDKL